MSKEEVMRLVKDQMPIPNPTPRGIGKEEVNKLVQEALAATQDENVERNAQVIAIYGKKAPFITHLTLPRFNL